MRRIVLVLATAVAAFAGPSLVLASPFNGKDVASDPATILHFDCDVIRTSAIGQSVLSQPEVQDKLASVGALFDFDFLKQLHGITFYTTVAHSKDGVFLVYADFDIDRLLAKAQTLNDFHGATNGSHVIYSWLSEKWKRREGGTARAYGAISGHRVILSQSESRLADALDVMEGKARGFEGKNDLAPASSGEAILLQAALLKIDVDNAQGPAAIFTMSKSTRLKVSEANNNTTAAIRFETADNDAAAQVNVIAQGLLGMLKMASDNTNAMKLANSIAIAKDGLAVGVTLSIPSSKMIEMMKAGQEEGKQRRANRRARDKDSQPNNK
jgi:hypothetical protein